MAGKGAFGLVARGPMSKIREGLFDPKKGLSYINGHITDMTITGDDGDTIGSFSLEE